MKLISGFIFVFGANARLLPDSMRLPQASEWTNLLAAPTCPCEIDEYCEPIQKNPEQEIFGFGTDSQNWKFYPWDIITSVAWADKVIVC